MIRLCCLLLLPACASPWIDTGLDPATDDTGIEEPDDTNDDTDTGSDTSVDDTGPVPPSVFDVQAGDLAPGAPVTLTDVVVIGVSRDAAGLFVAEPEGGEGSGVWVYLGEGADGFARGDRVTVDGVVTEYAGPGDTWPDTLTQIDATAGGVVRTGDGAEPDPVDLTLATFDNPAALEPYEGALVRVTYVAVTDPDLGYGEFEVADGVRVGTRLSRLPGVYEGDIFHGIVGVLDYGYGAYKLLPRDADDLQNRTSSVPGVQDAEPGALVVTEVMADPGAVPSACADTDNEYVELLNTTSDPLGLAGLEVVYGDASIVVPGGVVVDAGGRALLGRGDLSCYGVTPDAGFTFSLTNTAGKPLRLLRPDGTALDEVDLSAFAAPTPGVAIGLSPDASTAADNDDPARWCLQTSPIGASADLGTPGADNDACAD